MRIMSHVQLLHLSYHSTALSPDMRWLLYTETVRYVNSPENDCENHLCKRSVSIVVMHNTKAVIHVLLKAGSHCC